MNRVLKMPATTYWRLQPIVAARSGSMLGFEMLTTFATSAQAEHYFQHATPASIMQIFEQQLVWIKEQGTNQHRYFCNLPVSVLSQASFTQTLKKWDTGGVLPIVELQDPEAIPHLSDIRKRQLTINLAQLHQHSISLWLDDITPALLPVVQPLMHFFDGVKIDKEAFWQFKKQPLQLNSFVEKCRQLSPLVLIEGIETSALCQLATQAGADYLQGFLWPELMQENTHARKSETV